MGKQKRTGGEGTPDEVRALTLGRVIFWHSGGEQGTSGLKEVGKAVIGAKQCGIKAHGYRSRGRRRLRPGG